MNVSHCTYMYMQNLHIRYRYITRNIILLELNYIKIQCYLQQESFLFAPTAFECRLSYLLMARCGASLNHVPFVFFVSEQKIFSYELIINSKIIMFGLRILPNIKSNDILHLPLFREFSFSLRVKYHLKLHHLIVGHVCLQKQSIFYLL